MSVLLLIAAAAPFEPLERFSDDQRRRMMADFAACVVSSAPRKASNLVLGGPFRAEDENFRITMRDCLPFPGRFRMMWLVAPKISMRFAFAEAFLRREPSLGLPLLQLVPPLKHDFGATGVSRKTSDFEVAISSFGECVVRTAPAAATALVRSESDTSAETTALAAIKPAASSCLTAGRTVAFSPDMLRGTVALNYYRFAKAAGGAQ